MAPRLRPVPGPSILRLRSGRSGLRNITGKKEDLSFTVKILRVCCEHSIINQNLNPLEQRVATNNRSKRFNLISNLPAYYFIYTFCPPIYYIFLLMVFDNYLIN
jgi:hypothetical protein